MRRSVLRALALVPLYAVLVGWLTWPLATHLTTHHPQMGSGRDFDSLYSAWVLAWESHALASGIHIGSANIYYPEPDSLYYGPAAFGALPFFAPVYLLTGNPALALNLLFLGCLTLMAAMVHFVVHAWTRLHTAGLVAAVALLANRWLLLSFVPGVPHISVLFYFPLIILLSSSRSPTWPRTVLLGLLVVAQGMTDVMYIAPSVLIPLAVLMVLALARRRTRSHGWRLLLIIAVAGVVLIAVHAPYLSVAQRNPQLLKQTLWNLDPLKISIAVPWGLMGLVSPLAVASLVPALILVGGLLAAFRWRGTPREASAWRHCALWAAIGIAISLPGHVTWLGHLYALPRLHLVQFSPSLGRLLTHTERLRVPALMGFALLAGLAFAEILRQCNLSSAAGNAKRSLRAALAVLVCVVMYVQYQSAIGQPLAYGPRARVGVPGRGGSARFPRAARASAERRADGRGAAAACRRSRGQRHGHVSVHLPLAAVAERLRVVLAGSVPGADAHRRHAASPGRGARSAAPDGAVVRSRSQAGRARNEGPSVGAAEGMDESGAAWRPRRSGARRRGRRAPALSCHRMSRSSAYVRIPCTTFPNSSVRRKSRPR